MEKLLETRVVARPGVVSRQIANETLLVPVSSQVGDLNAIYTLSGTAPRIWALLQHPVSTRVIVDAICREYDVPAEVATEDVTTFLEALAATSLVVAAQDHHEE